MSLELLNKRNKYDISMRFKPIRKPTELDKAVSAMYKEFALKLFSMEIDSRCKTIALERLEESYMWATKEQILEFDEVSSD